MFNCLPNSAWADWNSAEVAVQPGKLVEHPNQSQLNPGLRADESPCRRDFSASISLLSLNRISLELPDPCTTKNHVALATARAEVEVKLDGGKVKAKVSDKDRQG